MSDKPSFDEVWVRVRKRAGETFITKTGIRFNYSVRGNRLLLNRTSYTLSKRDFMKAYPRVPMDGPSEIASMVRGPPTSGRSSTTRGYLLRLGDC